MFYYELFEDQKNQDPYKIPIQNPVIPTIPIELSHPLFS